MRTCRAVAASALRKIGKAGGGREPRQADLDTAMDVLRGLYRQLITVGAFGRLIDVIPTTDYVARENERVFRSNSGCTKVDLPLTVDASRDLGDPLDYGSRWVPPGDELAHARPPRDCSVVEVVDGFTGVETQFIYDGQAKKWQGLHDLLPDSRAPLADRDPDGLASLLAAQINDEFGGGIGALTLRAAAEFRSALAHRYSHSRASYAEGFM